METSEQHSNFLIVLGGPTASGKTDVAIQLAQHFQTEIISADSRQVFREMPIGTGAPTQEELEAVPHHLILSRSVKDDYSVGAYTREVLPLLDKLFQKHNSVILVGGSGLYIKGVCEGLDTFPDVPDAIRKELQEEFEQLGLPYLQKELEKADPDYYAVVDQQNPVRLLRALSVCRASGAPYSSFLRGEPSPRNFKPIYLRLQWDRAVLYQRIEQRIDKMMDEGWAEEAQELLPLKDQNALQTLGYQELFDHFEGKYDLEEAIQLIKRNTRRFAKRQETWFRRGNLYTPFEPQDLAGMIDFIQDTMRH